MTKVNGIRGLILKTSKIDETSEFYRSVWGLEQVESKSGNGIYFRGTGPEPCILGFVAGDNLGVDTSRFALEDKNQVDAAHQQLSSVGVDVMSDPERLDLPGDYYGFYLRDPDGNRIELSSCKAAETGAQADPFVPQKMSHFVFNSPDNVAMRDFYVQHLGFELADWYGPDIFFFLRCTEEHHCLGVEKGNNSSLNHMAYHVADLDAMMRRVGQLKLKGIEPLWGPGRHGPGGNCFCYFVDPNGYVVEYTSELIQIPEGTEWTAREWTPGPQNANVWGTGGRDERTIKLMSGVAE